MKIVKGDTVLIISGKDRGKKGKVLEVLGKQGKLVVEGVNIAKKHRRPKKEKEKGQVVEIAKPFDASNVKLVCPKCGRPARVGYRLTENRQDRICKKCGEGV